jgi:hypothetical protein
MTLLKNAGATPGRVTAGKSIVSPKAILFGDLVAIGDPLVY